jgi:hypothetical protein
MRREQQRGLVSAYLARGGTIHHLPTPEPTEASDVLDYLEECGFSVYRAPRGEGEPKYVFQGQVMTLQNLMSVANEHRAKRALPPFQLVPRLH